MCTNVVIYIDESKGDVEVLECHSASEGGWTVFN
jgi:hypothetical protein